MSADIVDAEGRSLPAGAVGELVLRGCAIGTTRGLWNNRERYLDSYWRVIPGLWVQGDLASRDEGGYWRLHGRSDDTIKVSGRRVGPAEIEDVLMGTGLVIEAAVVGVPDTRAGAALVAVVIPGADSPPAPLLRRMLADAVTTRIGNAFNLKQVLFVGDLPRTRHAKVLRRVIRSVLARTDAGDLSALANPETIDALETAALLDQALQSTGDAREANQ